MLFDARLTTYPPVGAGPLRLTVPVEVEPPITDVGETATLASTGGLTVNVVVTETVPFVAVKVTGVALATAVVVIVTTPVVAPARIVTLP